MVRSSARVPKRKKPHPYYDLAHVKELVADPEGHWVLRRALVTARVDFGWGIEDIRDAVRKLRLKHYCKTSECRTIPGEMVDCYKARGLKGEDVYLHFCVDLETGCLVIQSCHRLEE
jgi:hypothetical protein